MPKTGESRRKLINTKNMSIINVHVDINLGDGDATILIFNHNVSYEHYFSDENPDDWNPDLAPGVYAVNFAGACPPGGTVILNITKILNSNPVMPITANTSGQHFLKYATITV